MLYVWQDYTAPLENHSTFNISNLYFSKYYKCDSKVSFKLKKSGYIYFFNYIICQQIL